MTGINFFIGELAAKRLELLRELVPTISRVAVLINPVNTARADSNSKGGGNRCARDRTANPDFKHQHRRRNQYGVRNANARAARRAVRQPGPFLHRPAGAVCHLAARHAIPTSFATRDFVEAGGLMSYGTDLNDAIAKPASTPAAYSRAPSPADLPVVQSTKFELVINAQTARMLGLTVPPRCSRPPTR